MLARSPLSVACEALPVRSAFGTLSHQGSWTPSDEREARGACGVARGAWRTCRGGGGFRPHFAFQRWVPAQARVRSPLCVACRRGNHTVGPAQLPLCLGKVIVACLLRLRRRRPRLLRIRRVSHLLCLCRRCATICSLLRLILARTEARNPEEIDTLPELQRP